jgi:hypothetical protein
MKSIALVLAVAFAMFPFFASARQQWLTHRCCPCRVALTTSKYGDRSDAIGKRFGKMKTKAKFSKAHVFHSIRKTVVTLLENAGVLENISADIVGHEKPRITYGLYSGGASLEVKRDALAKLKYPKPL